MSKKEHWASEPEPHDYPAAADYLALLAGDDVVASTLEALRLAPVVHKKAKDLLRASRLELLPTTDIEVAADLKKVKDGEALSPVLLVRGRLEIDAPLIIADGYHRICASYHLDENAAIPCKIAEPHRPD